MNREKDLWQAPPSVAYRVNAPYQPAKRDAQPRHYMEHRLDERWAVALDAHLTRRGWPPIQCVVQNISVEGMYVSLPQASARFGPGDAVEVRVSSVAVERADEPVCALVVHSSALGAGFCFSRPEPFGRITVAAGASAAR